MMVVYYENIIAYCFFMNVCVRFINCCTTMLLMYLLVGPFMNYVHCTAAFWHILYFVYLVVYNTALWHIKYRFWHYSKLFH